MPAFALITALAVLVGGPMVLGWMLVEPVRPWRDEFATALAMAGFAALLAEFLLSGRFRAVSGGIGIDRTMRWHQVIARLLTAGLLLHPFLYTLPSGAQFLRPGDATQAGVLAPGMPPRPGCSVSMPPCWPPGRWPGSGSVF